MLDATKRIADAVEGLAAVFGVLPKAAANAASGINDEFGRIKTPRITIPIDWGTPGDVPRPQVEEPQVHAALGATAAKILQFKPRGMDVIPAMVAKGESILTAAQTKEYETSKTMGTVAMKFEGLEGIKAVDQAMKDLFDRHDLDEYFNVMTGKWRKLPDDVKRATDDIKDELAHLEAPRMPRVIEPVGGGYSGLGSSIVASGAAHAQQQQIITVEGDTFTISALDAKSVEELLEQHGVIKINDVEDKRRGIDKRLRRAIA